MLFQFIITAKNDIFSVYFVKMLKDFKLIGKKQYLLLVSFLAPSLLASSPPLLVYERE